MNYVLSSPLVFNFLNYVEFMFQGKFGLMFSDIFMCNFILCIRIVTMTILQVPIREPLNSYLTYLQSNFYFQNPYLIT